MGLSKAAAEVLLRESCRRPLGGSVLTLGRQDISFAHCSLCEVAKKLNVKLADPGPTIAPLKADFAERGFMSDTNLFNALGFDEFSALDASGYESAHHLFDLNKPELPHELEEAFDLIIDGGTLEHVFHVPNALRNIYKMLRVGGRIVHIAPSSNHIDHGFYMFSPTLFADFYDANQFELNTFQVFKYSPNYEIEPWEVSNYTRNCLDAVSFGGLDDGMYGIICIATKLKESTGNVVPQQGRYCRREWGVENQPAPSHSEPGSQAVLPVSRREHVKRLLRRVPFLRRGWRILKDPLILFQRASHAGGGAAAGAKKGLGLEVVARY